LPVAEQCRQVKPLSAPHPALSASWPGVPKALAGDTAATPDQGTAHAVRGSVGEVDRELAEWQNSEGCHQWR